MGTQSFSMFHTRDMTNKHLSCQELAPALVHHRAQNLDIFLILSALTFKRQCRGRQADRIILNMFYTYLRRQGRKKPLSYWFV